jgi:hypothetical protein
VAIHQQENALAIAAYAVPTRTSLRSDSSRLDLLDRALGRSLEPVCDPATRAWARSLPGKAYFRGDRRIGEALLSL